MAETRLGLDVGPTRTLAAVVDSGGNVLARAGARDPRSALGELSGHDPELVVVDAGSCLAGALEQGRVARVAVVRIAAPLTLAIPPLSTWPHALRAAVSAGTEVVAGGAEYHGGVAPLDEDAIARFLERSRPAAVAIAGIFATIAPEQELAAAEVARRTLGRDIPVALSHEIGVYGLLERENATVLNAALTGAFDALAATLRDALPSADAYVARGDGTLIALTHALRLPITAVGSGWASALQGAFRLTGVDDAVVAFADGRSIALGGLRNGLPRESSRPPRIAGVSVAVRLPEIRRISDPRCLAAGVRRLAGGMRRPVLVAVAGAGELLPDAVPEVAEVISPPDAALARALGAGLAVVGGEAERMSLQHGDAHQAVQEATRAAACERAVQLGADPRHVAVVDVQERPIGGLPQSACLIRVRAAGPP
jgi:hypothetical protein